VVAGKQGTAAQYLKPTGSPKRCGEGCPTTPNGAVLAVLRGKLEPDTRRLSDSEVVRRIAGEVFAPMRKAR
jgi:hypothetical protein